MMRSSQLFSRFAALTLTVGIIISCQQPISQFDKTVMVLADGPSEYPRVIIEDDGSLTLESAIFLQDGVTYYEKTLPLSSDSLIAIEHSGQVYFYQQGQSSNVLDEQSSARAFGNFIFTMSSTPTLDGNQPVDSTVGDRFSLTTGIEIEHVSHHSLRFTNPKKRYAAIKVNHESVLLDPRGGPLDIKLFAFLTGEADSPFSIFEKDFVDIHYALGTKIQTFGSTFKPFGVAVASLDLESLSYLSELNKEAFLADPMTFARVNAYDFLNSTIGVILKFIPGEDKPDVLDFLLEKYMGLVIDAFNELGFSSLTDSKSSLLQDELNRINTYSLFPYLNSRYPEFSASSRSITAAAIISALKQLSLITYTVDDWILGMWDSMNNDAYSTIQFNNISPPEGVGAFYAIQPEAGDCSVSFIIATDPTALRYELELYNPLTGESIKKILTDEASLLSMEFPYILQPAQTYYFRLRSENLFGYSSPYRYNQIAMPPAAPRNFRFTSKSSYTIEFSWDDIEGENHYVLFSRRDDQNLFSRQATYSANETISTGIGIIPGRSYEFYLTAVSPFGSSLKSEVIQFTAPMPSDAEIPANISEGFLNFKVYNDYAVLVGGSQFVTINNLSIPATIQGVPIVKIADDAFCGFTNITGTIEFPESIVEIGHRAFFGCTGLTTAPLFNAGLNTIGTSAFEGCSSMSGNLAFPDSLTTVGAFAFANCSSLNGILTFGSDLLHIGDYAFSACSFIGGLSLPEGLRTIGSGAFNFNPNLIGLLVIPSTVRIVGSWAFASCRGFSGIEIEEGVKILSDFSFYGMSSATSLVLPSTIEAIGLWAFAWCENLAGTIVIPEGITRIECYTFQTTMLENITVPSTVTYIGTGAFQHISTLDTLTLLPVKAPTVGSRVFLGTSDTGILAVPNGSTGYDIAPWTDFVKTVTFN